MVAEIVAGSQSPSMLQPTMDALELVGHSERYTLTSVPGARLHASIVTMSVHVARHSNHKSRRIAHSPHHVHVDAPSVVIAIDLVVVITLRVSQSSPDTRPLHMHVSLGLLEQAMNVKRKSQYPLSIGNGAGTVPVSRVLLTSKLSSGN